MRYFQSHEFDSKDKKGSGSEMNTTFLSMLDEARAIADIPFKITSGYRTKKWNKRIGGVDGSSHCKGLAADIKCIDSKQRGVMLKALREVGFTRIGIAKSFIHCDISTDKSQNVTWLY